LRSGAYRRAINLYRQALSSGKTAAKTLVNLFDALVRQGDYVSDRETKRKYWNEARELYEGALKRYSENPWFHYHLGIALERLQRWDAAGESFREAIKMDRHQTGAWRELAYCLARKVKFQEAVSALEEARVANPADTFIEMDLVRAYTQAERFDAAVALARELSQRENPVKDAAQLLRDLEDVEQAAAQLRTEPLNAQTHAEFAGLQEQLRNWAAAAARYREATLAEPAEPRYRESLARVLAQLEDWQGAAIEYEAALERNPDEPGILYGLGVAREALARPKGRGTVFSSWSASLPEKNGRTTNWETPSTSWAISNRREIHTWRRFYWTINSHGRMMVWRIAVIVLGKSITRSMSGGRRFRWMAIWSRRHSILGWDFGLRDTTRPLRSGGWHCSWIQISPLPKIIWRRLTSTRRRRI